MGPGAWGLGIDETRGLGAGNRWGPGTGGGEKVGLGAWGLGKGGVRGLGAGNRWGQGTGDWK